MTNSSSVVSGPSKKKLLVPTLRSAW